MEINHLHTLATDEVLLLVNSEILLRHHTAYGAILHKHNGVAEALILQLERHTDEESAMLGTRNQLLQHCLRLLLHISITRGGKKRRTADGAGGEDGQQSLARGLRLKFALYPFEVLLGSEGADIMLYDMYFHLCFFYS